VPGFATPGHVIGPIFLVSRTAYAALDSAPALRYVIDN